MTLIDFKLNLVIWYMTAPIYAGCVASSFTGAITRIVAATITTIHTTSIVASGCSLGFNKRYTCHNHSTDYRQRRFGCLLEELTTRLEFLVLLWVRHKNLSFFCIGTPAMRVKNKGNWVRPYKGQHERHRDKKSVGVLLMSFPLLRLSHCLSSKNDNAKPTPI